MKAKSQFVLNVTLFTLGLIGGLSLAIVMAVIMMVDEAWDASRLALLVLGSVITVLSSIRIIKLNKKEEERRVDLAVNQHFEFITGWTVAPDLWGGFLKGRLERDRKEARYAGIAVAFLFGLIATLMSFQGLPLSEAIFVSVGAIVLGYFVGVAGARKTARSRFVKDQLLEQAEVHFAKDLIVMNGQLIQLKDLGIRPVGVNLEKCFGLDTLLLKVETGLGNRKSTKNHWIPVPPDRLEEANRLCQHYASLI